MTLGLQQGMLCVMIKSFIKEGSVVRYKLVVTRDGKEVWTCLKRFSELRKFYLDHSKTYFRDIPFPERAILSLSDGQLEQRKIKLQKFLVTATLLKEFDALFVAFLEENATTSDLRKMHVLSGRCYGVSTVVFLK
jgi:hypothetical protein